MVKGAAQIRDRSNLVIEGRLTLGALVAVLAAYKDFSSPLRELFRYYQSSEDVRIRYEEMLRFLGAGENAAASQKEPSSAAQTTSSLAQIDLSLKLANVEAP